MVPTGTYPKEGTTCPRSFRASQGGGTILLE